MEQQSSFEALEEQSTYAIATATATATATTTVSSPSLPLNSFDVPKFWSTNARWNEMTFSQAAYRNIYHTSLVSDACKHLPSLVEATFCFPCFWCQLKANMTRSYNDRSSHTCCHESLFFTACCFAPVLFHCAIIELFKSSRSFFSLEETWGYGQVDSDCLKCDCEGGDGAFFCGMMNCFCWPLFLARESRELLLRGEHEGSWCVTGNALEKYEHRERFLKPEQVAWFLRDKHLFLIRRLSKRKMKAGFEIFNVLFIVHQFLPIFHFTEQEQHAQNSEHHEMERKRHKDVEQLLHPRRNQVLNPEHLFRILPTMT